MDSFRDELLYSNVKGKNPFKDARVRKAFYQAIDIEAIHTKVMRGMSVNSALLISPLLFSRAGEFKRWPYDVAAAKKLLAEAGYPERLRGGDGLPQRPLRQRRGDLPGRGAMLARIGIKVKLNALPKAKYFEKAGPTSKYDSSFNLLGWTPGSLDSWNVLDEHHRLPRRRRQGRHLQLRRLLQSEDRRAQQADPGRDRHRQARRADRRGLPHQP